MRAAIKSDCETLPNWRIAFAPLSAFRGAARARHVAAIGSAEHVLAQGLYRLAGDDPPAERSLDRHLEEVTGDEVLQPFAKDEAMSEAIPRTAASSPAAPHVNGMSK